MPTPRQHAALLLICLTSAGWAFSFGAGSQLASLWLQTAGLRDRAIGANTGTYYLGMMLGAVVVPGLMRRWGVRCAAAGMVAAGLTAVAFPWGSGLAWWFAVRLLNGVAGAMSVIPMETYINRDSTPGARARNFGFYAVSITLGYALGNGAGVLCFGTAPLPTFALGGAVAVVSGLAALRWLQRPTGEEAEGTRPPLEVRRNLLSYGSAWNQGFLEGGMVAFMAIYLFSLGLADAEVSGLTSLTVVGIVAFQLPVAWLADRLGRTAVLLGCYLLAILGLVLLPLCGPSVWLAVWLFVVGACSGAFYPLGLALLGERLPDSALARANACYLAVECAGCVAGPVVMGLARDEFGPTAMFPVGLLMLSGSLLVWAALRVSERRAEPRSAEGTPGQRAA
jgi:MFS family permease